MRKFKNLVALGLVVAMVGNVTAGALEIQDVDVLSVSDIFSYENIAKINSRQSNYMLNKIKVLIKTGKDMEALETAVSYYESLGVPSDMEMENVSKEIIIMKQDNKDITSNEIIYNLEKQKNTTYFLVKLTATEIALATLNPVVAYQVNACRKWAQNTTYSYYQDHGSGNNSDAFRHAYWNALMSHDVGEYMAKQFADAHEAHPKSYFSKIFSCNYSGRSHTDMDLHNNAMGRDVMTSDSLSYQQLMDSVLNKIRTGQHRIIHVDTNCK